MNYEFYGGIWRYLGCRDMSIGKCISEEMCHNAVFQTLA
jgi:hypothetical protein